MPKTIMLAITCASLADELTAQGFRVVDSTSRPGQAVDAYLYTSYRPGTEALLSTHPEPADISIGNYHEPITDHPATIMLNITGLNSGQVIDTLRHRLARRPRL